MRGLLHAVACTNDKFGKCREEQKDWKNPFLPYDKALYVTDLSATHHLLLNKFNVVAHHVLVVTKQFEKQTDALNLQDMEATWQVVQVCYDAQPRSDHNALQPVCLRYCCEHYDPA